ncbi:MAG: phage tail protein [Burkholderiaceae bacterium]
MKLGISTNFPDVQRQINDLRREVTDLAVPRAMNRTMEQARTAMSREIRSQFVLPVKTVNDSLRIIRASFKNGRYNVEAALESPTKRGRSLNLIHFAARQTNAGVTVRISKQGGRKLIRSAFIGNKGRTVFVREGKKRLPIRPVQTIDVAQMFNTRRINKKVIEMIEQRFPTIFGREARYYARRFEVGR